ncbi:MAG: hypothetical protein AB1782_02720 [Cyanobacteriota bacterium]
MTSTLDKVKIKMDGQEHEITNAELDNENRSIYLDLDDTISIHVEDVGTLFNKNIEILRVGHDDDYIKAQINSFYVESEKENQILSLTY